MLNFLLKCQRGGPLNNEHWEKAMVRMGVCHFIKMSATKKTRDAWEQEEGLGEGLGVMRGEMKGRLLCPTKTESSAACRSGVLYPMPLPTNSTCSSCRRRPRTRPDIKASRKDAPSLTHANDKKPHHTNPHDFSKLREEH